jgi:nickel/cobalt exporter
VTPKLALSSLAILVTALLFASVPRVANAHPMGNFSINHYTRIRAGSTAVELDYIIDMAEIPTFQEMQESGLTPKVNDPSVEAYLDRQDAHLRPGLTLEANGHPLQLVLVSRQAIFPPGAGGLPTMKMGFIYRALLSHQVGAEPLSLHYRDDNFPNRAGWKEIVADSRPETSIVDSSVPPRDRSAELTNYPTDLLHSPPQVLEATISFKAAPVGALADSRAAEQSAPAGWLSADSDPTSHMELEANRQGTPRSAFTELIRSQRHDLPFFILAALVAAVLGGLHALEPGHGKTLVAAYLVGSHGTPRHAVLLGGVVTASHTVSVYVLGLITLYASQWILPEQLYPWLGTASGLLVAGLGLTLFLRRYLTPLPNAHSNHSHDHTDERHEHTHNHSQGSEQPHDHPHIESEHRHNWWGGHVHDDSHAHGPALHDGGAQSPSNVSSRDKTPGPISLRNLFALGVTGGIIPCPAALVVLLGALAIHRVAFGLFLIVAFSIGLSTVLISFGLMMVYAGRIISRAGTSGPLTERWLPLASSALITVVGIGITLQSLVTAGVLHNSL